jgi:hypothetical protein
MQLKPGNYCPLLKKDCIGLKCAWITQIKGHNPNTGEAVDQFGCAIAWLPMLLVENSQMQRQTGAAMESFRNEMVRAHHQNQQMIYQYQQSQAQGRNS